MRQRPQVLKLSFPHGRVVADLSALVPDGVRVGGAHEGAAARLGPFLPRGLRRALPDDARHDEDEGEPLPPPPRCH